MGGGGGSSSGSGLGLSSVVTGEGGLLSQAFVAADGLLTLLSLSIL